MRIKDYIKRLFEENNKKLVSNINTSIDTKIEESVPNIKNVVTFTPIGTIIAVMGNEAPENYLVCDGTIYNITDYQELANYFETQFGTKNHFGGDGITTFGIPDLRGEFLRGTGTNSHENNGNGANVGVHQDGTKHLYNDNATNSSGHYIGSYYPADDDNWFNPQNIDLRLNNTIIRAYFKETGHHKSGGYNYYTSRPTNTSVLYCIATKNIYLDTTNTNTEPSVIETTTEIQLSSLENYYNTEERIIGKWINGKPIYQKTFKFNNSSSTEISIDCRSLNIERPIDIEVNTINDSTGDMAGVFYFMSSSDYINAYVNNNKYLVIRNGGGHPRTSKGYITLKYTKTTDSEDPNYQIPDIFNLPQQNNNNSSNIYISKDEYILLSEEEKNNGNVYFVHDYSNEFVQLGFNIGTDYKYINISQDINELYIVTSLNNIVYAGFKFNINTKTSSVVTYNELSEISNKLNMSFASDTSCNLSQNNTIPSLSWTNGGNHDTFYLNATNISNIGIKCNYSGCAAHLLYIVSADIGEIYMMGKKFK